MLSLVATTARLGSKGIAHPHHVRAYALDDRSARAEQPDKVDVRVADNHFLWVLFVMEAVERFDRDHPLEPDAASRGLKDHLHRAVAFVVSQLGGGEVLAGKGRYELRRLRAPWR